MKGVRVFRSNDAAFLAWVDRSPRCYFLNCGKGERSPVGILHRATCRAIRHRGIRNLTTMRYMKVGADNYGELLAWVAENRSRVSIGAEVGSRGWCARCFPKTVDVAAGEEPVANLRRREGKVVMVAMNQRERDETLRRRCLRIHGVHCAVCEMSFEEHYGKEFSGYIHVHHLKPLSKAPSDGRKTNAERDLVPLCPNCHAAIHFGGRTRPLAELRRKWKNCVRSRIE